ncbi:MAG: hypothetical protein Q8Q80_01705 [Methyloversatilis sp.]|uniref:hypothetical protein n=1 Tax=Methyloversatilis sp. TaxID=2569862 RepID=UPI0027325C38|nr:hypothetical protein [Methyloversatilis sp.]MDP3871353.1 hypothetical protein [Methyloversatilis sp.]
MKSLLFVVNEAGEFIELRRVALIAKARGYQVNFLFAQPGYLNLRRDRAFCQLNGFREFFPGKKLQASAGTEVMKEREARLEGGYMPNSILASPPPLRPLPIRIAALAMIFALHLVSLPVKIIRRVGARIGTRGELRRTRPFLYARTLFDLLTPDLVVFGQEFPGSVNALLTRLCNTKGVPTLIIPFAVGTTKEMVESLSDKTDYEVSSSLSNRLAALLFPNWVNYYGGKALLRLPGRSIIAIEAAGLAPEHPWLPNNSKVTCIAVESPEMERYYRHMRFPPQQLRLTGTACDDSLSNARGQRDELKRKLCRLLRLNPAKRILLCAWPTDQFQSRHIPLEFNSYDQLCWAWARALSVVARMTDFEVVIRPHPVTDPAKLAAILSLYQLHERVTDIDTLELVPVCDLFVACVSSTLRWAAACGIPAINYDCYDYGYTDFEPAGGISTVRRFHDFQSVLQEVTEEPAIYERARLAQTACSAEWGLLDGCSADRIMALIDELSGGLPVGAPMTLDTRGTHS